MVSKKDIEQVNRWKREYRSTCKDAKRNFAAGYNDLYNYCLIEASRIRQLIISYGGTI